MSTSKENQIIDTGSTDPRWKDLYRIGGIASLGVAVAILLAIGAYFIWPYKDELISMETIFATLQADRLGGLISLDLSMLLIAPINMLIFLALYAALKRVNESYALIALAVMLLATVLVIQCRPLVELAALSDKYASAADPAEKLHYLAAGEALRAAMEGTAWVLQTVFFMVAGLINCLLMLRTHCFSKATAWTGIVISLIGLGFFLPGGVGLLFLFLNTIGSVPWCLLVAKDLLGMNTR